jgi:hypothetical protein
VPSCPQGSVDSFLQTPWGSPAPAAATAHSPGFSFWAQLTQAPVQAVLQQTPSAQNPEAQSVPQVQAAPSGLLLAGGQFCIGASIWPGAPLPPPTPKVGLNAPPELPPVALGGSAVPLPSVEQPVAASRAASTSAPARGARPALTAATDRTSVNGTSPVTELPPVD